MHDERIESQSPDGRLRRPAPPVAEPPRSTSLIWMGLIVGVAAIGGLALTVSLAMGAPPLAAGIAIAGGIFALGGLQYAIWGWWLGPMLRRAEAAESRKQTPD